MAEEKKEDAKKDGEVTEGKKGNKLVIIIVVALVVVLIIIGVVIMMLMGGEEESEQKPATPVEQTASADATSAPEGEAPADAPAESEATEAPVKATSKVNYKDFLTAGPMFPVGEIFANLMSDSGRRYLKANVVLEQVDETAGPELTAKSDIIKSVITEILSSQNVDDASTTKGRQKIKAEILAAVNSFLNDGKIKSVLFTQYIIQ